MNIASHERNVLQPLLSSVTRIGVAVAVIAMLAAVWLVAGRSSEDAVQLASAELSRTHITLPRVEVIAKREVPPPVLAQRDAL